MDHNYFVYLLTDKSRSTLYIGVTNNLESRLWQHRNPERASFTQRYHCIILVHYEHFPEVLDAIAREKELTRIFHKIPDWRSPATSEPVFGSLGCGFDFRQLPPTLYEAPVRTLG